MLIFAILFLFQKYAEADTLPRLKSWGSLFFLENFSVCNQHGLMS